MHVLAAIFRSGDSVSFSVERRLILLILPMMLSGSLLSQTLSSPESVRFDSAAARFLISNRGAGGSIQARDLFGNLTLFSADPISPAGIEIVGNLLYVADQAVVRSYALSTGLPVATLSIPGAAFLNGMISDGADRLWVSDFTARKIHELDISNPNVLTQREFQSGLGFQPNGLRFDMPNQRLLVASWGTGRIFNAALDGSAIPLLFDVGSTNIDGVTLDCDGALYLSSWGAAAIKRYPPPITSASVGVNFVNPLSNPADISYAPELGVIASPNAGSSTVTLHNTNCVGVSFRDRFEDR